MTTPLKVLLGASLLALAACETTEVPVRGTERDRPVVDRQPEPDRPVVITPSETPDEVVPDDDTVVVDVPGASPNSGEVRDGVTPANLAGVNVSRLGLLLPLSSENPRLREEAQSMLRAAELAVFAGDGQTVLVIEDTGGTESGARRAAMAVLDKGADVILGPVLASEVAGASREASRKGVPVLAFSTDSRVAGRGTYLMSFPPEAEVRRVVDYAASTGVTRYAIIHPENAYGRRVAAAYREAVARAGGSVTASESYNGETVTEMQAPVQRLADAYGRSANPAYQAVMLPEGGTALRSLAPLLPYSNTDLADVLFLGTALWMREDTAKEPALRGGVFAGPDEGARAEFEAEYQSAFGREPTRLASLAHDAVTFGAAIADPRFGTERIRDRLEDREGFYGADGFVSFRPDGSPERGLAIYEIQGRAYRVKEPAPRGAQGSN